MKLNYEELEAKCAAMAAENVGLKSVDVWMNADEVGGSAADKAIENGATPEEATRAGVQAVIESIKTPATDAFLAEVQAQAHKEGAHFVANRMLAAWEAGFIDDTAKNAADIAWMILTSTEFMADAPEGDFDRSFADGILEDIAAQLRKGVQS